MNGGSLLRISISSADLFYLHNDIKRIIKYRNEKCKNVIQKKVKVVISILIQSIKIFVNIFSCNWLFIFRR